MDDKALKIVELRAENVKRLEAVEIRPDGELVVIAGSNGSGKSSLLDAIFWALAGTSEVDPMPIRKGAQRATIRLDMGELVVERRFTPKGSELRVENPDGAVYRSPQTMLDAMLGELAFDPLDFARRPPAEQVKLLRKAVASEVDFDDLERRRQALYDQRRDLNRDAKRERTLAGEIEVPGDLPEAPLDLDALIRRGQEATAHNQRIQANAERRRALADEIEGIELATERRRADLAAEIAELEQRLARKREELAELSVEDATRAKREELETLAEEPEQPVDTAAIRDEYVRAKATNEAIGRRAAREWHLVEAKRLEAEAKTCTDGMAAIEREKADAITRAQLPVEGLSWSEDGITLAEVPFAQASTAEQIRTGLAIAMAANPKIRVIRIKEGSALDRSNLALVAELAREREFQVWIEVVRSDDPAAIVIEDGRIAARTAADEVREATSEE